jgi:hypothetical protein
MKMTDPADQPRERDKAGTTLDPLRLGVRVMKHPKAVWQDADLVVETTTPTSATSPGNHGPDPLMEIVPCHFGDDLQAGD